MSAPASSLLFRLCRFVLGGCDRSERRHGEDDRSQSEPQWAGLQTLEDRVLFGATSFGAGFPVKDAGASASSAVTIALDEQSSIDPASEAVVRREAVFVDAGLDGYEALLTDLRRVYEPDRRLDVFVVDTVRDGVEQVSNILAACSGLDAVHIISCGTPGALRLGSSVISSTTLSLYEAALVAWSRALSPRADLRFYGCDIAAGPGGGAFVSRLADLTGTDVAVSDLTSIVGDNASGGGQPR